MVRKEIGVGAILHIQLHCHRENDRQIFYHSLEYDFDALC
jgi:hypothetical protein